MACIYYKIYFRLIVVKVTVNTKTSMQLLMCLHVNENILHNLAVVTENMNVENHVSWG